MPCRLECPDKSRPRPTLDHDPDFRRLRHRGVGVFTIRVRARLVSLAVAGANDLPTITPLGNQTIAENGTTGSLAFAIGDVETAATSLIVSMVTRQAADAARTICCPTDRADKRGRG